MNGRGLALLLTLIVVAGAVIAGLRLTGSPARQRALALDTQRVEDLGDLARAYPAAPARYGRGAATDPVTHRPYRTRAANGGRREWCAVFETDTRHATPGEREAYVDDAWRHPAGPYCFVFTRESGGPALRTPPLSGHATR